MVPNKSLDEVKIIAALLHDVSNVHGLVFNTQARRNTIKIVERRVCKEGLGFLTKTLPRLCKAFDKALAGNTPLNAVALGFSPMYGTELPRFLGEFFSRVLHPDGTLLPNPCALSVGVIRQLCVPFGKYELPYEDAQEQQVIARFEKTEQDLSTHAIVLKELEAALAASIGTRRSRFKAISQVTILREAKILLSNLFSSFDPLNIVPRHGPGAVATKQKLWEKYLWTNISSRITNLYPLDSFFKASLGHVCDTFTTDNRIDDKSLPARVILVPKDSRGPRLISCEPVDFQWIQQGLGRAIVEHVERHDLTRDNVHFTDQTPNRIAALYGSENGRYSTIDLNEASDRVSSELVRLLFPENVYTYLMACRTTSTVLPDGREIPLQKFAPMGSCLCFPILALTTWAILAAGAPDAYTRERILVYGDDVIVTSGYTANAIEHLESFGLKVNRDKSCTSGLFRESCGMDAFQGIDVTPVRFRTVWSSLRRADSYSSWVSYANSLYDKRYFLTYDYIVSALLNLYGPIPDDSMHVHTPRLRLVPDDAKPKRRRFNKSLQKLEYYVTDIKSPVVKKDIDGWSMLLRYFTESGAARSMLYPTGIHHDRSRVYTPDRVFSVGSYTSRRTSMLVRRWR